MQWKAARWTIAATLLFGAAIAGATTSYNFTIDSGASSVDAKVAFMGIGNRKALFPAVRGTVALTPDAMDRINLDVMIDATQLRADDSLTTNRLKGDAFFNVAKYPTVRFQGTDLSMATQTSGIVRGNLTARGVTRPVTLNVSFSAPPSTTSLKDQPQGFWDDGLFVDCRKKGDDQHPHQIGAGLILVVGQILCDLRVGKQALDIAGFVKAFISKKFKLGCIFHANAGRDFALQKGGVGAQCFEHIGFVCTQ
jgi:polyisoprenoid-binding protein YceI